MSQLDLFLPLLATSDTKKKLSISSDIINYLELPGNSIECEDIGGFVDGIIPWMNQSNFRVSRTTDVTLCCHVGEGNARKEHALLKRLPLDYLAVVFCDMDLFG